MVSSHAPHIKYCIKFNRIKRNLILIGLSV
jgi:hypothetical protein